MGVTETKMIVIGAGLTGLSLAYFLNLKKQDFLLLEARDRIGGRIHTARQSDNDPLELGATWLGKKHTELVGLMSELGIGVFEQVTGGRAIYEAISSSPPQVVQLPHNDEPSYRIAGGSDRVVQELASKFSDDKIRLNEVVQSIEEDGEGLVVTTDKGRYKAAKVVSTLPPYLFVRNIKTTPALPADLVKVASSTHTWMGESIKVGLRYAQPFWREDNRPGGTIFSNVGPVSEMYDHTNLEDSSFALKGFLNGAYHSLSREERRDMVLAQLRKYFGDVVDNYTAYEEGVWRHEPHTFVPYEDHVLPHQNNGHPVFRSEFLNGRLILAGSETAVMYPGYMDGAVRSARRVAELVVSS